MEEYFRVRCYNRRGDFDHETPCDSIEEAEKIRTEWGIRIGLKPEPSTDFAKYPTIWKKTSDNPEVWERILGY